MSDYQQPTASEIEAANAATRYVAYSVFAVAGELGSLDRQALATEVADALAPLAEQGLIVRGYYDVSALRADADVMVWWHAPTVETLQAAYAALRKSRLGAFLESVWSVVGLHRPAEFNKSHLPAFITDPEAGAYVCVYPFVRSYDWYLMDPKERSAILREHGMAAADYRDVKANTVNAFALGDYEFLLAFEAEQLERIVDLMRELRDTRARLHVREEIPFFTGPRRELAHIIGDWR